jgi:uncharacterized protein YukJ
MPGLSEYGVLKGKVIGYDDSEARWDPHSPHVQIHVACNGYVYKVQINVKSSRNISIKGIRVPNELLYLADHNFQAMQITHLQKLKLGYYPIKRHNNFVSGDYGCMPEDIAIDYIRSGLFNPCSMLISEPNIPGGANDLADFLINHMKNAQEKDAIIYVYGEPFNTPLGMHDVHMNQGSNVHIKGRKKIFLQGSDGVYQDGCMLLQYQDHWEAIFLAFRSQSWCTDDVSGNKVDECHIYKHDNNEFICDLD